MSLVLDASVSIAWVKQDEITPILDAVFDRVDREGAWVPSLWWLEVANALQMNLRRQRLTPDDLMSYLNNLRDLPILTDEQTVAHAWDRTLQLANKHQLTVYDAAYLELALRRALPLATLDRELRTAATAEGVPLLGQ